eukprot:TRINITY_DN28412_c0_g1_i1.p1 TRINITY_DN28412_c0_g1~~TRINITY_DN28412_c0_g1_i1.p1  ORF type:complete len:193 (+),score=11.75 TRINITY_DN28412_c0_g1_i1:35-613(+)
MFATKAKYLSPVKQRLVTVFFVIVCLFLAMSLSGYVTVVEGESTSYYSTRARSLGKKIEQPPGEPQYVLDAPNASQHNGVEYEYDDERKLVAAVVSVTLAGHAKRIRVRNEDGIWKLHRSMHPADLSGVLALDPDERASSPPPRKAGSFQGVDPNKIGEAFLRAMRDPPVNDFLKTVKSFSAANQKIYDRGD